MKILVTESQYKILLKEFMGSVNNEKFMDALDKFSNQKNIHVNINQSDTDVYFDFKLNDRDHYPIILDEINEFIKPYNWFISNMNLFYQVDFEKILNTNSTKKIKNWIDSTSYPINRLVIDFEKVYNENENMDSIYYHVTDIKNAEEILTKGLYPRKSQNLLFDYPERIYLANDVKTAYIINDVFKDPTSKKDYGREGTVVFEIKLPLNIKTYRDPKAPNSSYIMEPVHPKYIEIYDYMK